MHGAPDIRIGRWRMTAPVDLDVYHQADSPRYGALRPGWAGRLTPAVYRSLYAGCPSVGFEFEGRAVGGAVVDGFSVHLAVLPAFHGRWAVMLRPLLRWLFDRAPAYIIGVDEHNAPAVAFIDRCGWPVVGHLGGRTYHRISALGGCPTVRV